MMEELIEGARTSEAKDNLQFETPWFDSRLKLKIVKPVNGAPWEPLTYAKAGYYKTADGGGVVLGEDDFYTRFFYGGVAP